MWWHDISSYSKPCSVLVYSKNGCKGQQCAVVTHELISFIRTLQARCCSSYLVCAFLYRKRQQVVTTNITIENIELTPVGYASLDLNYVQYKDGKVSNNIEPPLSLFANCVNTAASIYAISFYCSKAHAVTIYHACVYVDRNSIICCKKSNTEDI